MDAWSPSLKLTYLCMSLIERGIWVEVDQTGWCLRWKMRLSEEWKEISEMVAWWDGLKLRLVVVNRVSKAAGEMVCSEGWMFWCRTWFSLIEKFYSYADVQMGQGWTQFPWKQFYTEMYSTYVDIYGASLRAEWANVMKPEIVRMSARGTGDCIVRFEKIPSSQMRGSRVRCCWGCWRGY